MNALEAAKCVKKLSGLFMNQVSQEQFKLLVKEFQPFNVKAVERAIVDHRKSPDLKDGFLNIGKLLEGCRAAERGEQLEARQFIPDQSFAGIFRHQRSDPRDRGDYEVIIRVHRDWWNQCSRRDEESSERTASESYQRQIAEGCANILCSAGMDQQTAREWAAYCFLKREDCPHWLDQIKGMRSTAEQKAAAAAGASAPPFEFAHV